MNQPPLFTLPPSARAEKPVDHRRIKLDEVKKEHAIWTHRCKGLKRDECPWTALKRPDPDPEPGSSEWDLIAAWCSMLEAAGYLVYGETEFEAVRELCQKRGLPCTI